MNTILFALGVAPIIALAVWIYAGLPGIPRRERKNEVKS